MCFRLQVRGETPSLLCLLERANLIHWKIKAVVNLTVVVQ
jgi:hypothetical protein